MPVIFSDDFTGSPAGTLLRDHTPDGGLGAWTDTGVAITDDQQHTRNTTGSSGHSGVGTVAASSNNQTLEFDVEVYSIVSSSFITAVGINTDGSGVGINVGLVADKLSLHKSWVGTNVEFAAIAHTLGLGTYRVTMTATENGANVDYEVTVQLPNGNYLTPAGGEQAAPIVCMTGTDSSFVLAPAPIVVRYFHTSTGSTSAYRVGRVQLSEASAASIVASPTTITQNSTGNSVTLTGTGTSWTAGNPGSPAFTLSGGTGAAITAQSVASATSATLTIDAGSATGVLTVTDPDSGATVDITVVAPAGLAAGVITRTAVDHDSVELGANPSGGTAPYTHAWHRSLSSGFTPDGSTLLAGQASAALNDTTVEKDTLYFYRYVVTDNAAASETSNEFAVHTYDTPIHVILIGDSITAQAGTATTLIDLLKRANGFRDVTLSNRGVSSSSVGGWQPGSGNLNNAIAEKVAGVDNYALIMLGTNGGGGDDTGLAAIRDELIANGITPVFNQVIWSGVQGIAEGVATVNSWLPGLADGLTSFVGDDKAYGFFAENPGLLSDNVHPTGAGQDELQRLWAMAFARMRPSDQEIAAAVWAHPDRTLTA